MQSSPGSWLARYRVRRGLGRLAARYMARPFAGTNRRRVVIYHVPNRIGFAQIFPFVHYQRGLASRYDVAIRCFPFDDLVQGRTRGLDGADVVLLQPWFTIPPDDLKRACDLVARQAPQAELSFIDCFAHNDLRLARHLPGHLRFYIKKSLFRRREDYLKAYRGDTNLTEYFSALFGIPAEPVDFGAPAEVLPKLRLSPNFLTAPEFVGGFRASAPPPQAGRSLDVQLRLGARGSPWYSAMRQTAIGAAQAIPGLSVSGTGPLSRARYMQEMRASRLCFSPFGFGELCWRDIEAFQTGAVLIKPDMGHLETLPELYEAGATYLPVAWDLSDLEQVVRQALDDAALRERLAAEAHRRVTLYLAESRFVTDMGFLFTSEAGQSRA